MLKIEKLSLRISYSFTKPCKIFLLEKIKNSSNNNVEN